MMNKKLSIIFGSAVVYAALLFSSCSSENTTFDEPVAEPKVVTLRAALSPLNIQSRAASYQNETIDPSVKLGLFVAPAGSDTPVENGNNACYAIDDKGQVTPDATQGGGAPVWPEGTADIYCYMPYQGDDGGFGLTGSNVFRVQTDQTTQAAFLQSDLAWGKLVNTTSAADHQISLKHRLPLVKIQFELEKGFDVDVMDGATVKLINTSVQGTFDVKTGNVTADANQKADITVFTFGDVQIGYAQTMPQTLAKGTQIARIILPAAANEQPLTRSVRLNGDFNLKPNSLNTLTIKLGGQGTDFTAEIVDFISGGEYTIGTEIKQ